MLSAYGSFLVVFALSFTALKLLGVVSWSWWWLILSPLWLLVAVYLVAFLIALVLVIINGTYQK